MMKAMTSATPFWWFQPWLVCCLVVPDHNCQVDKTDSCFRCIEFDGIENPECSFPVGRGAEFAKCGQNVQLGEGAGQAKCAKVVVYSEGYKDGWQLKSWLMKRHCFKPTDDNYVSPYGDLNPPCGTCGRTKAPIRIFQRQNLIEKKIIPQKIHPDEQNQVVIYMCTCCEPVCNNEEGFNLTYFTHEDEINAGNHRSGLLAFRFFAVHVLIQFGLR